MQFVVLMRAGIRDPHTAVHKLEQMEAVSKVVLLSNPHDIFVMIEAPSLVEANRLLAEVDMFEDVAISEVLYDPADHPDLVFETPWANQYPKPKLKAAELPIIDSVPEFVPNRHGRTYTNISSQAGVSSFVGGPCDTEMAGLRNISGMHTFGLGGLGHLGDLIEP